MGNDDALSSPCILTQLKNTIEKYQPISVAITNYQNYDTHSIFKRMNKTGILGCGASIAASTFRHYSFISGIIFDGKLARESEIDFCDGSEMYQMYLGAKLISAGGRFLSINDICVDKDISLPNQKVDRASERPRISPCPIIIRPLPMGRIIETVAYGIKASGSSQDVNKIIYKISKQMYLYTYFYWIFQLRKEQSFNYSLGVYIALSPNLTLLHVKLGYIKYIKIWFIYIFIGLVGFLFPYKLFFKLYPFLYKIAKK